MTKVMGVILAGGLARRMGGGDKGLLELGGKPILSHVIDRIAPQVDHLILNANGDANRFAHYGLPVVSDSIAGYVGPLAGVLAGMDYAAEHGYDAVVSVAADTPFFPTDLVVSFRDTGHQLVLAATLEEGRIVRHPTFGFWPVDLRDDLRQALQSGLRKVVIWTDQHDGAQHVFTQDGLPPFFNVNTPEDLTAASAILERTG